MGKPEKFEDVEIPIDKKMQLVLKENRSSSTLHAFKDGYQEVSSDTKTYFHWQLKGIASKFGPDVVSSEEFDRKQQEIYYVTISSNAFDIEMGHGFKTREAAIVNALAFAERNGIEVDGYKAAKKEFDEQLASPVA